MWAGESVSFEDALYPITRSGQLQDAWFTLAYIPVLDEMDQVRGILVTVNETTERVMNQRHRQAAQEVLEERQQQQAFLLKLSDTLRAQTGVEAVGNRATQLISQRLEVDRVYLVTLNPDDDEVVVTHEARRQDLPPLRGSYRSSDFPAAIKEIFERTIVYTDVRTDARLMGLDRLSFAGLDAVGFMATSIRRGKHMMIWAAGAVSTQPRSWTASEVVLFEDAVERTWAAVERAKAEEALKNREAHAQAFNRLIPALIWRADAKGKQIDLHVKWLDYTGQTLAQSQNYGWLQAIHPEDRAETARMFAEAFRTGQPIERQQRIQNRQGDYRWYLVKHVPVRDEAGLVIEWFGVAIDIHDLKQAEDALRIADQRKDEFLDMLARELRNPMSTIRSGLQILTITDGKDQTSSDTIDMMNRQTDHLVRMVDDLLDVSRISQGKIELKRERLELGSLVRATLEAIRPQFETSQKILELSLSTPALFVQGDPARLSQVVTNLLTNGLHYTEANGQVWVRLVQENGEALLGVSDDGIGLSPSQLTSIFELFVQADTSLARSRGGLGVGLTLVKRLVELHAGRVDAQSLGLGQGSRFRVYLPLAEVAKPERAVEVALASSTIALRVLVIDDNADAALTLSMLLKLKGYEVHSRHSGRAGIQGSESLRPAVILCDIGMPELDGYTTCRLIRGEPWGKDMILIALTGYGQEEDRQRITEAGFDGHLVKPVDLDELQSQLTSLLTGSRPGPDFNLCL